MNTESQTDRITQLEASCAAMRESLLRIEKFEEEWGPHSLTAWNEVVATCKQSLSSTDAGKSLLDRITQLEAACAAMREALTDPTRLTITGGVVIPGDALNKALSTSAGKDLLERLQNEVGLRESALVGHEVLSVELRSTQERLQKAEAETKQEKEQHEIDNKGNQEWIDSLCSQLCKMEDALGFKNDCYDKQGKWIPTIEPWMERLRDLLAAEGELGDLKHRLQAVEKLLAAAQCPTCDGRGWYSVGHPDGHGNLQEEQEQCQWCAERNALQPKDAK